MARYGATAPRMRCPLTMLTSLAGTLLAMLGTWVANGGPHYYWTSNGQSIPYISDIAATHWGYPLFIAGSATTVAVFDLAFISERWLRHKGRLTHNYTTGEKVLSIFAIIFAIVGAAGLILLTVFDTRYYPKVHIAMLIVFMYVGNHPPAHPASC